MRVYWSTSRHEFTLLDMNSPTVRLTVTAYIIITVRSSFTPVAIIDSPYTSGTSTLETDYSNFIARQLYAQKWLEYRNIQYWHTGESRLGRSYRLTTTNNSISCSNEAWKVYIHGRMQAADVGTLNIPLILPRYNSIAPSIHLQRAALWWWPLMSSFSST